MSPLSTDRCAPVGRSSYRCEIEGRPLHTGGALGPQFLLQSGHLLPKSVRCQGPFEMTVTPVAGGRRGVKQFKICMHSEIK